MATLRNKYIEFTSGWSGLTFKYSSGNYNSTQAQLVIYPIWGKFFIELPWKGVDEGCDYPEYGFYYFENQLVICMGRKTKHFSMPWDLKWFSTSLYLKDNTWTTNSKKELKDIWDEKWQNLKWVRELNDLEIKVGKETVNCSAKVSITKTILIPYLFYKLKLDWFKSTFYRVNFEFSTPIGDIDSWKGGTIESSFGIKKKKFDLEDIINEGKIKLTSKSFK